MWDLDFFLKKPQEIKDILSSTHLVPVEGALELGAREDGDGEHVEQKARQNGDRHKEVVGTVVGERKPLGHVHA